MELPVLPSPTAYDIAEKSQETMDWLRNNIKVGFVNERGPAWWASQEVQMGMPDGSHFEGPVPIEEVRRLLDIKLVKGTVYIEYEDENGERQVVTDERTAPILNQVTGKVFSYPTASYKIHPYLITLHGFIKNILDDPDVGVGSVGLLKKGGVAFIQVVLPEEFSVAGYGYVPYLMAVTSADLSRSTFYGTGAKGAVCDNTVNTAVAEALTSVKYRHTSRSGPRVAHAREKLGIQLREVAENIGASIEALVNVPVSDAEWEQWLDLAAPLADENGEPKVKNSLTIAEKKRDELSRLYYEDEKAAQWNGTGFGVLQTDNTYRTWTQTVRSAAGGRLERNLTNDAFGVTSKGDEEALRMLGQVKQLELV